MSMAIFCVTSFHGYLNSGGMGLLCVVSDCVDEILVYKEYEPQAWDL